MSVLADLRQLTQTRGLLWAWTSRNLRGRYQQSLLGWLWAIVQPISQVAIFTFIFTRFVPVDTGDIPYVLFSYLAIVPWTFLSTSLVDMTNSVVENMGLVVKIHFPREILPIAAMLARFIDYGVALSLAIGLMFYFQVAFSWRILVWLPILVGIQLTLTLGIGLACAALNVYLRDVRSLLLLAVQLWFYLSPIIYPVSVVPGDLRSLYFLNPMAGILESYRAVFLRAEPPPPALLTAAVFSLLVLVVGYVSFKRMESRFADIV